MCSHIVRQFLDSSQVSYNSAQFWQPLWRTVWWFPTKLNILLPFNSTVMLLVCCVLCVLLIHFSCVWLFAILQTVAHQAPLSIGFSSQEFWNGLPCPPPGDLPNPGPEPTSLMSSILAGRFFTTSTNWEAPLCSLVLIFTKWVLRLPGEISITSDMQVISPLWQKIKTN